MSDTYEFATHRRLQQLPEHFDAKTRLSDDDAQGAGLQVSAGMHKHGCNAGRVIWIYQYVMAAGDAVDNEACSLKGTDNVLAACDGQSSARHT
jgi:hypothetical protein